ncbi:hypothetical protein Mapa_000426 [Marchantia paleacea]|nr:hypothetical protein Mapa_000426 [Marchantia paleacea]
MEEGRTDSERKQNNEQALVCRGKEDRRGSSEENSDGPGSKICARVNEEPPPYPPSPSTLS